MLRGLERRLARIEESDLLPVTAERFLARARRLAKRNGGDLGSAMAKLAQELTDAELEAAAAEFEQIVFGSDTAARDAAKRAAFAEAGCPELDKSDLRGTEDYI